MLHYTIHFTLNDAAVTCTVPPHWTLYDLLQQIEDSRCLFDACTHGDCCRCTVLLDGRSVCACQVLAVEVVERAVQTRAGLAGHPVVQALESLVGPCGSCIDAFTLTAIDCLQTAQRDDGHSLDEALLAIPCTCQVNQQVRHVVQHHWAHVRREGGP